jgi:hypothetical protein
MTGSQNSDRVRSNARSLRYREMPPTGREIGDARHVRKGDDAAVLETDALLARSFERGACHRPENVAGTPRGGKHAPRARVMNDFAPCTPAISRDP